MSMIQAADCGIGIEGKVGLCVVSHSRLCPPCPTMACWEQKEAAAFLATSASLEELCQVLSAYDPGPASLVTLSAWRGPSPVPQLLCPLTCFFSKEGSLSPAN